MSDIAFLIIVIAFVVFMAAVGLSSVLVGKAKIQKRYGDDDD